MTERELAELAAQAAERWSLLGVTLLHRHGRLAPGDDIVLVITLAAHRQAAFDAAMFLMDHLKTRATFWKSEERRGGERNWVSERRSDTEAAARWRR